MRNSGGTNTTGRNRRSAKNLPHLSECLTETGGFLFSDICHEILFTKSEFGPTYLFSQWHRLSDVARVQLFEHSLRAEIVASAQEIIEALSHSRDSTPVINVVIKKLCFTKNPVFLDIVKRLRADVDESVKEEVDRYISNVRLSADTVPLPHQEIEREHRAIRIYIDEIESFNRVRETPAATVSGFVPLKIPEAQIKQSIAEIVGESFVPNDWGGETADLFTSNVIYKEKRRATGFLLKGPAVRGPLRIKHLGKNGDQIVRLASTSLELYVVQFVAEIDQAVIDTLEAHTKSAANKLRRDVYFCVVDGTDTARLLVAYNKVKIPG